MNHEVIKKILDTSHDHNIGQFMDQWGDAADDPQTALLSIAASLQQLVVEVTRLRQVIVNGSKS